MSYSDFIKQVVEDLPGRLNGVLAGAEVREAQVSKLQGKSYEGISVTPQDSIIGITVDLKDFYQMAEAGVSHEEIMDKLSGTLEEMYLFSPPEVQVSDFTDYESIKNNLYIQLVGKEANKDMLLTIPHRDMGDMAIVYRFHVQENEAGMQSVLITDNLMEKYDVSEEQLYQDALASDRTSRYEIKTMAEVLSEMMGIPMPEDEFPMYVASNENRVFGAGVIANPDFLEKAHQKLEDNFYILPSSIHEVILIPEQIALPLNQLEDMVQEINTKEVAPADRLSDRVYHYDGAERRMELAENYENRKNRQEIGKEAASRSVLDTLHNNRKECAEKPRKSSAPVRREETSL